jgi:hypothetical protein
MREIEKICSIVWFKKKRREIEEREVVIIFKSTKMPFPKPY